MLLDASPIIFISALLFLIAIVVSKVGNRFGIPTLLLFLLVGIVFGEDVIGIKFNSPDMVQLIGMISLTVILFSGGLGTRYLEIRPVFLQGSILATLGVILTAGFSGLFIYAITQCFWTTTTFTLLESMLLGSVMSSTDSASVFSILGSKGFSLKERLRPLLEFESGSNDPMAYMLTILFIQVIQTHKGSVWMFLEIFFWEFFLGILLGIVLGVLAVRFINKINIDNVSFYPIILLCIAFIVFAITNYLHGNGYLAAYICGLIIGNAKIVHKYSGKRFLDGVAWLCQGILFLSLGLLVNPSNLIPIIGVGIVISLFLIFVARPAAVAFCLLPFRRISKHAKIFTSWVGLRGAAPIVFATYPLMAGIERANMIFNIVFFVTLISLVVQGTTISPVAKWLNLIGKSRVKPKLSEFEIEFSEDIKSTMTEVIINAEMLQNKHRIMDLPLPDKTLVVMVKRNGHYFVPKGSSKLEENDIILLISEDEDSLQETHYKLSLIAELNAKKLKRHAKWDRLIGKWL